MPLKLLLLSLCIFLHAALYSQNAFDTKLIKPELTENAYVVTRMHEVIVDIPSIDKMYIKRKVALTILNRKGSYAAGVSMYYRDGAEKIKSYKINIYDSKGKLVKKVKKKEVSDQSVYDGFSMASDVRTLSYKSDYADYPYTLEYEYEEETAYTTFIPSWDPYMYYYQAVEQSTYNINTSPEFLYSYKLKNGKDYLDQFNLENAPSSFSAQNLKAILPEQLAPHGSQIFPKVMFSPSQSKMDKTEANFENWSSFGIWMYDAYLKDKSSLSDETKKEVAALISPYNNDFDKAKAIYEYATKSTRYVSIQLGEGGWEPFYAEDVHAKKYGDCKALSMYTLSLMKEANLDPFYVIIGAGIDYAVHLEEDFASIQGNHAIIGVPIAGDTIFADCTTSTSPFGFYSSFTDGRLALAVSENGGSIVRTHRYQDDENSSVLETNVKINPSTKVMELSIKNALTGERISSRMGLEGNSTKDIAEKIYPKIYPSFAKENFIDIKGHLTSNDSYEESFKVNCQGLISTAGDYLLLPIQYYPILLEKLKDNDRKLPIYIKHGFSKTYNYSIAIPERFEVGELLEPLKIVCVFGAYELMSMSEQEGQLNYTISMKYKSGTYSKEKAAEYNKWIEEIQNIENKNILLKPTK